MSRPKSELAVFDNSIQRDMLIIYWRKKGLGKAKIAEKLNVDRCTITNILDRYPSFGFTRHPKYGERRPCLQCDRTFQPDSKHKWICPSCKMRGDDPPLFDVREGLFYSIRTACVDERAKERSEWLWKCLKSAGKKGPEGKRIRKLERKLNKL